LDSVWIVSSAQFDCSKHRLYSIRSEWHVGVELTPRESVAPTNVCAIEDPIPNPNPCLMEDAREEYVEAGAETVAGAGVGALVGTGANEVADCPVCLFSTT